MESDWSIEYGPYITREFKQLNSSVVQTVLKRVERLLENPILGKPIKGKASDYNLRALRITTGQKEFRLIYQLWEKERKILVIFIGSREDVYERLERWLEGD